MCDVLTLAGIALTAGSTVANTVAANKVAKARDQALAAERIRQQGYDQEADALNLTSQDRFQNFDAQQEQKASELGQYFQDQKIEQGDANTQAVIDQTSAPTGSNLTVREEAKQRGAATDFANRQGAALGELRSFGDLLGAKSIDQSRDAQAIGQVGGFKRGSSGIVPLELEQANRAGDGAKMFGDLLGLGGGLLSAKGLSGGHSTNFYPAAPKAPTLGWQGPTMLKPGLSSLYVNRTGLY